MVLIGFKSMEIRILDGKTATEGENLFKIEGKAGKGATKTANITGLSSEPTKTYGSDLVYHTVANGVGDVKADFGVIDLPATVEDKILGYRSEDGLTYIGARNNPPKVSVVLLSETSAGEPVALGFFAGKFSRDAIEFETKDGSNKELPANSLAFSAEASTEEETKGDYMVKGIGTANVAKVKSKVKVAVG